MSMIIKRLAIVILFVLIVLSLILASVFVIPGSYGRYNTGLAIGGIIAAIVIAGALYILGYALGLLEAIQASSAETASSSAACAALLSQAVKGQEKPEAAPAAATVAPAAPAEAAAPAKATPVNVGEANQPFPTYAVDKSKDTVECPACGMPQRANRNVCFKCGARFVDANAALPAES